VDLNNGSESLAFTMASHTYVVHSLGPLGKRLRVGRYDFELVMNSVKGQCKEATEMLIQELERRFSHSNIIEAMGVVFLQYWLNLKFDDLFFMHMQVICKWHCEVHEVVVPINKQPIVAKGIFSRVAKETEVRAQQYERGRGSGYLLAEQRERKGKPDIVGDGIGSDIEAVLERRQVAQPLDLYRLDW
jgi:hypothetical protein